MKEGNILVARLILKVKFKMLLESEKKFKFTKCVRKIYTKLFEGNIQSLTSDHMLQGQTDETELDGSRNWK